jgi:2-oxoglutarate dehydrogenase E2 component (dihydrolipoamide succinyltransferase)
MEIKVPAVGESVLEALVAKWEKKSGDPVSKDDVLCELETDKITFNLQADAAGTLTVLVPEGETVKIGTVIGTIEEAGTPAAVEAHPTTAAAPPSSPSVRKLAAEQGIDLATLAGSGRGGRIVAEDLGKDGTREQEAGTRDSGLGTREGQKTPILSVRSEEPVSYGTDSQAMSAPSVLLIPSPESRVPDSKSRVPNPRERRVPMTPIRKKIAERLLAARQQTAMLTTFNEVDMSRIVALRQKYREHYQQRFGSKPGLMPFFVKACCEALREFPAVNAAIDGSDIVYHDYYDIGIAIGGEKGLVVPVLRDADRLRFREIDAQIEAYTAKVQENRLAIADLEGGTFTVSNGGVYGSLLSTPIINPPQSAVLGMHAIQERAVVRDGQIVIRPMMYLALSYDHRLIDGRVAVQFLKRVKELVEEPEELLLEG